MLTASSSILCRKRTTGASSTSAMACSLASPEVSAVTSSNSNSVPTMLLMVSAALAAAASIMRESLSYSAMTQSTPICDANLIFSAACWSDGSAVATIRRLLRLLRTTMRYAWQSFGSSRSLGRRW
ncbi:hypothetical protein D9M68_690220 [compost metagenome]